MPPISDVVKHLLIINVVMFFGTVILVPDMRYILALFYPTSDAFQPFQLVTHMFMHADGGHLLFNMFGLYMFGVMLEHRLGVKRFLIYYLSTGFGAMLLYLLVLFLDINYMGNASAANAMMWGASGSIFGLMAGFGLLFPNMELNLIIPPIRMKAIYFVLIFGTIEYFFGLSGVNTGIAHFAHLGGALFGFIILMMWKEI